MGKGTRKRISRDNYLLEQEAKKKAEAIKKKKMRKIGIIITSCVLVIALISGGATYAWKYATDTGYFMRNTIAVKTNNYKVDNMMMSYFVNSTYQSYIKQNASYLSYYGLDTTKPLDQQTTSGGDTWYNYFLNSTKENVKQVLVLAEAAKADGITLSDEDQTTIDTQLKSLTPTDYGQGVNSNDIKKCLEIYTLAYKYNSEVMDKLNYTDIELENYYNQNKNTLMQYNYRSYTFSYASDADKPMTQAEAKAYADKLYACNSDSNFTAWLSSYLKSTGNYNDATDLQKEIDSTLTEKATYTADDKLSEWAFTEGRKAGDTYLLDNTDKSCYTVYIIVTAPDRDNSNTVDVRHILFTSDTYGSADKALAKAQDVYDQWKSGDQTEESFATLATSYSEDTGSSSDGGLYKGVYQGQMVDTFNDWCFDTSRKPGDTGIVSTSYGYHIMYFVGLGGAKWKADAKTALQKEDYNKIYSGYESKYTVTMNDENINKVSILQS